VGVPLNAWLVAGAALEGRAHPFFHLNPAADQTSAALMDFSSNPQPRADWPVYRFDYRDENGTAVSTDIAFTFADYALLIKRLRDHFRLIPAECDSDLLLPVDQYLALDLEQAYQRIPFVLAVDGSATLRRLVISRELIMACRDRLNYWRTLQELAGERNRYVEQAIDKTRTEERAQAAAERERLQAQHAEELERVRNEAAGEAMQRLTQVLLGLDLSGKTPAPTMISPNPSAHAELPHEGKSSAPEATIPDAVEEEAINFDEAWIDSLLCTSCNDCLSINPTLFVYNENKQAIIGDRNAGTFTQLVQAAESCPAHCIHPGKPMNLDEPGLDELIERAAPFNAA
jgi:ferredoxin